MLDIKIAATIKLNVLIEDISIMKYLKVRLRNSADIPLTKFDFLKG